MIFKTSAIYFLFILSKKAAMECELYKWRMGGCVHGWMDGWVGRRVGRLIGGWLSGRMGGWMHGWLDGWVGGWVGSWMDEWLNGWSAERQEGWRGEHIYGPGSSGSPPHSM